MKKTAIAIAVALAGFATVAQAAPKDNTWYAGGKLGWSQYHDTGFYGNGFQNNNGPTRNDQLGAGAFGGYQVNPYLGFEMGYDWLGRMAYKGSVDNGAFKAQGVQLTAKLGYPITDDLDIYTRLGGMVWRADSKGNYASTGVSRSEHDTGVSPVFAGGVEWAVTRDIATRLEYQWVNNIGDAGTVGTRPDNGMLSPGGFYRFGQGDAAPVVAPAPAPAPLSHQTTVVEQVHSPVPPAAAPAPSAVHAIRPVPAAYRCFFARRRSPAQGRRSGREREQDRQPAKAHPWFYLRFGDHSRKDITFLFNPDKNVSKGSAVAPQRGGNRR